MERPKIRRFFGTSRESIEPINIDLGEKVDLKITPIRNGERNVKSLGSSRARPEKVEDYATSNWSLGSPPHQATSLTRLGAGPPLSLASGSHGTGSSPSRTS